VSRGGEGGGGWADSAIHLSTKSILWLQPFIFVSAQLTQPLPLPPIQIQMQIQIQIHLQIAIPIPILDPNLLATAIWVGATNWGSRAAGWLEFNWVLQLLFGRTVAFRPRNTRIWHKLLMPNYGNELDKYRVQFSVNWWRARFVYNRLDESRWLACVMCTRDILGFWHFIMDVFHWHTFLLNLWLLLWNICTFWGEYHLEKYLCWFF